MPTNGLIAAAKQLGPVVGVLVAGVTGYTTLSLTVDALAGGAKEAKAAIEENQRAITTIKIITAVQAERDKRLKEDIADIKAAVRAIVEAVKR